MQNVPSRAIISLKIQVELLSQPRWCGLHGVSTVWDGECHLDAFHPLPMHNLGTDLFVNQLKRTLQWWKNHAISDTKCGGCWVGVYRGLCLHNRNRLHRNWISETRCLKIGSRLIAAGCQHHKRHFFLVFPCKNPPFFVSPYFSQSGHLFSWILFRGCRSWPWNMHTWFRHVQHVNKNSASSRKPLQHFPPNGKAKGKSSCSKVLAGRG